MNDNTENNRKMSKGEFHQILSHQIQILQNIQTQAKSILNLTIAVLAALFSLWTADIIGLSGIVFFPESAIEETANTTIFTENILVETIVSTWTTISLFSLFIAISLPFGYGKIISVFKTPEIKPILDKSDINNPISLVDEDSVDYSDHEKWVQNNSDLLDDLGEKYQIGLQLIGLGIGTAIYCGILYLGIIDVSLYVLIMIRVTLILAPAAYLSGVFYRIICDWRSVQKLGYKSMVTEFIRLTWEKLSYEKDIYFSWMPTPVLAVLIFITAIFFRFSNYIYMGFVARIIPDNSLIDV